MQPVTRLKSGIKQASVRIAEQSFRLWPELLVDVNCVPVFMLHRFTTPDGRIKGHDPSTVTAALKFLRDNDFVVLSLDELCERARVNDVPKRAVVFTIDDGYSEQGTIGAELFLSHDCPVTLFLATALTDGKFWPIEAKVAYLLDKLQGPTQLTIGGITQRLNPSDANGLRMARRAFVSELKNLPICSAVAAVDGAAAELNTVLPSEPPPTFAPLTWAEARRLEERGVRFGAHTARHVTLAREDDQTALEELEECSARVRSELRNPSNVFCYPTGRNGDYGMREKQLVRQLGYTAAVSAEAGYVQVPTVGEAPYDLQRFAFPDTLDGFKDIVLQSYRMREKIIRPLPPSTATIRKRFGSKRGLAQLVLEEMWWIAGAGRSSSIQLWQVSRLVFVCRGNVCRSAFADEVARTLNFDAISFGLDTHTGKPADAGMLEAARGLGYDLSAHRTAPLREYEARPGDLVAVFELDQLQRVRELLPDTMSVPLGRWAQPARTYIHDPFHSLPEFYRSSCETIEAATSGIIAAIRQAKGQETSSETNAVRSD